MTTDAAVLELPETTDTESTAVTQPDSQLVDTFPSVDADKIPRSRTVIELQADTRVPLPDGYGEQIKKVARKGNIIPVYPVGTIFTGKHAVDSVRIGYAVPANEACAKLCGMTDDQIQLQRVEFEIAAKGIHNPKDMQLYREKVILGYDEKLQYIPGPNWESHQAAQAQIENDGNV